MSSIRETVQVSTIFVMFANSNISFIVDSIHIIFNKAWNNFSHQKKKTKHGIKLIMNGWFKILECAHLKVSSSIFSDTNFSDKSIQSFTLALNRTLHKWTVRLVSSN